MTADTFGILLPHKLNSCPERLINKSGEQKNQTPTTKQKNTLIKGTSHQQQRKSFNRENVN